MAASKIDILKWDEINKTSFASDQERHEAYLAVRRLFNRLETTYETFLRKTFDDPVLDCCLKIGHDIKLYEALAADAGKPKTVDSLAKATGSQAAILRRVCKHLAAMEAIHEVGEDVYGPTEYSLSLLDPGLRAAIPVLIDGPMNAVRAMPKWLKENNYDTPLSVSNCPLQTFVGSKMTYWEWNDADLQRREDFNSLMAGKESGWKNAIELYPVQEKLVEGCKGVLLVDVGGGWGHDLKRFYKRFVDGKDVKLVLQDQSHVVAEAKLEGYPIEAMPHDFFAEQPIKAPRAFFMKQIIHDWPDEEAIKILSRLKDAMEPGYTKILLHDLVIPPTGAKPYATALDLIMCSVFGARERTQADWDRVIEGAGLHLEKIHSGPGYYESLLELVRKD